MYRVICMNIGYFGTIACIDLDFFCMNVQAMNLEWRELQREEHEVERLVMMMEAWRLLLRHESFGAWGHIRD